MTEEERVLRRAEMIKCLEIAMDIWTLIADANDNAEENSLVDVHIDQITEVLHKRFEAPLHKSRIDAIGYSIATALSRYGITSCGLWSFTHNLDHCLFEDDLSEIEAALAQTR